MPSLFDQTTRSPKKMLVTFAPATEPVKVTSSARKWCCRRTFTVAAPPAESSMDPSRVIDVLYPYGEPAKPGGACATLTG